jgi:hypothetical protein
MLKILQSKLERAERAEQLAALTNLRRQDEADPHTALSRLLPGPAWHAMAEDAGVPVAHIAAVFNVESRGSGFGPDGRLTVLYEPHVAYKYAKRPKEMQKAAPDLFYPKWISSADVRKRLPHAYRTTQEQRWDMILRAAAMDFDAAVSAVSWGRFQIMGYWAKNLGFRDTLHMIEHMCEGEENHLDVFLRYCRMDGLMPALRKGDWFEFARYN